MHDDIVIIVMMMSSCALVRQIMSNFLANPRERERERETHQHNAALLLQEAEE